MAKKGGGKEGKKETKNKTPSNKYKKYTINGDKVERAKSCPKCGPGVFMAEHKDRFCCGSCSYTEFKK